MGQHSNVEGSHGATTCHKNASVGYLQFLQESPILPFRKQRRARIILLGARLREETSGRLVRLCTICTGAVEHGRPFNIRSA